MRLISIGFGNMVSDSRIVSVISPDSAPVKRIMQVAKEKGLAIDATQGRKTRAVIITDSNHVIFCALQPETIASRLNDKNDNTEVEDDE